MSSDQIKIVLIRESFAGKISSIHQYAYKIIDPECATSITSKYISKIISFSEFKKSVLLEIKDTADQERYSSKAKIF